VSLLLIKKGGKQSQLFCAVLCTTVVHNDANTHEQFLNLHVNLGLDLVFVSLFRFIVLCVFLCCLLLLCWI